jgi:hypothetical protein
LDDYYFYLYATTLTIDFYVTFGYFKNKYLVTKCLRCPGQLTKKETFEFFLATDLASHSSLSLWMTNQTTSFLRLPDIHVDASTGSFKIDVEPDTIYTLSSLRGQTKGSPLTPIPKDGPFSLPHVENFESRPVASVPKYFSDNGGSFEIAVEVGEEPGTRAGSDTRKNQYLRQMVHPPPVKNAWILDQEAITLVGETTKSWSDNIQVTVDVRLPVPSSSAGGCLHVQGGGFLVEFSGHCVRLARGEEEEGRSTSIFPLMTWTLTANKTEVLLSGNVPSERRKRWSGGGDWYNVGLSFVTPTLSVWLEGQLVGAVDVTDTSLTTGRPALVSGWNDAHFDNFIAAVASL